MDFEAKDRELGGRVGRFKEVEEGGEVLWRSKSPVSGVPLERLKEGELWRKACCCCCWWWWEV